jgi:hypothetical protein
LERGPGRSPGKKIEFFYNSICLQKQLVLVLAWLGRFCLLHQLQQMTANTALPMLPSAARAVLPASAP